MLRQWSIVILVLLFASLCGAILAISAFKYLVLYIPLKNQNVDIALQAPLQARVHAHEALQTYVSGTVDAEIPLNETLSLPLTQTMKPVIEFDHVVPIKTTIPVKEVIKINQVLQLDSQVKVKVLGKDIALPVKGEIPIRLDVPVHLSVPVEQGLHLKFKSPVKVQLKEQLKLPIQTTLQSQIPIHGELSIPLKSDLKARVDIRHTLPVTIEHGQLELPLHQLRAGINHDSASKQKQIEPTSQDSNQ